MRNINIPLKIFLLLIALQIFATKPDRATVDIMPFVENYQYCIKCHKNTEYKKLADLTKSCNNHCYTCHKNIKRHHPVDSVITKILPDKLQRLDSKKKLVCITCHDLNIKRMAEKSYRSESLFESLTGRKSEYKTYYLVIRNNNGQLCKTCH